MRKFTLLIVAAFIAMFSYAQKSSPVKVRTLGEKSVEKVMTKDFSKKVRTSRRAAGTVADLVGTYLWEFKKSNKKDADPTAVEASSAVSYVDITATGKEDEVQITGMFDLPVLGTIDWSYGFIKIPCNQVGYVSGEYGECNLANSFYDSEDGKWYSYDAIYAWLEDDGSITLDEGQWICYIINSGLYEGYLLTPYFLPGSVMTKAPETEHGDYTFDDGVEGWTVIDADGDGYAWYQVKGVGHVSRGFMTSASYNKGALTPDNFLVSPKVKLGGKMTFYAKAQDQEYFPEVFNVAVSTAGNTAAADFTNVWTTDETMKAGDWYKYEVDLSAYAGKEGYVAIRHYHCTDLFRLNVDDVTISDASGINIVKLGKNGEAVWYNMSGQRVDNPGKGVFIQNGKKVVVK